MKFRKFGRVALATALSLGMVFGIAACGPPNTIDFLFMTTSKDNPGEINVYAVDSQAGALTQIQDSPYPSGGRNPVADATSPNGKNLYVLNHDDNTVVVFAIGSDAKIYPQQTCNTPGTFPVQLQVNPAGTFLYVVETYEPNYNVNIPGPGAVVAFPINSNGLLGASNDCTPVANGTQSFFPAGDNPAGVTVLTSGNYLYVVDGGGAGSNQTGPGISAFAINSNGSLTSVGFFPGGVGPNAIASDPTDRWVYITDAAANEVIGFLIQTNGTLIPMQFPFTTGNLPDGIAVDPRGLYVVVTNYNAGTLTDFAIDQGTGNLAPNAATSTFAVDAGPICLVIEPGLGRYVYTANFLGNTISGVFMNPATGSLSGAQNSPYFANPQPTCVAAVPHGNFSTQHVQP